MCKICLKNGPEGVLILEEAEKVAIDKSRYKGITVYVDHIEGRIHPVTLKLIGKARELAKVINHPVYALFMGTNITKQAEKLLTYGVDKVFVYDKPELKHFVNRTLCQCF